MARQWVNIKTMVVPEADPIPLHWFDYVLPPERIAHAPVRPRDAGRMMIVPRFVDRAPEHRAFRDLVALLATGDVLVVNRTKVIRARLPVVRVGTGGRGELLLCRPLNGPLATATVWEALGRPGSAMKPGTMLAAEDGTLLEVIRRAEMVVQVRGNEPLLGVLNRVGKLPLPPYIQRGGTGEPAAIENKYEDSYAAGSQDPRLRGDDDTGCAGDSTPSSMLQQRLCEPRLGEARLDDPQRALEDPRVRGTGTWSSAADAEDYQTVFATEEGAVAAPTASLHFTEDVLRALRDKGVLIADVLLHVGPGTFLPVRRECEADVRQHKMHAEWYQIPSETIGAIQHAKAAGRRVVAVGTTSLRALETWALSDACEGASELFVYPGFQFRIVDALLTNFHLPRSTLLMLVAAFSDRERVLRAYEEAIREKYRFFSYGDAMLLW